MNDVSKLEEEVSSLMKEKHLLEAIKLMNSQLPIVKENWELSWNLGWCYFSVDKFNESRKHLIRADRLAPDNVICKYALGVAYFKLEQYKKAELNLVESLRIKDSYSARICLALIYMKQRRLEEAESIHLEGIRLRSKEIRRHEAYADFLFDIGREKEAQQIYRKVKKLKREN